MDKNEQEDDALWDLLGQARQTEASPYFARKVLRSVKEDRRQQPSLAAILRWLIPTSALAALVIGFSVHHIREDQSVAEFNDYFDTAADLPSLVAVDTTSLWVDTN